MSREVADSDPSHLWPPFWNLLSQVLQQVSAQTNDQWVMTEGFRNHDRQLWIYGQGRPNFRPYGRPGRVVTWTLQSSHMTALAADVMPRRAGYQAPRAWWDLLRNTYSQFRLVNSAWHKGDLGHIEWPLNDQTTRQAAAAWVRAGFPPRPVFPPISSSQTVRVFVNGIEIVDAHGFLSQGESWVALRPLADSLGCVIASTDHDSALLYDHAGSTLDVPIQIHQGTGYCKIRGLASIIDRLQWDQNAHAVLITDAPPAVDTV